MTNGKGLPSALECDRAEPFFVIFLSQCQMSHWILNSCDLNLVIINKLKCTFKEILNAPAQSLILYGPRQGTFLLYGVTVLLFPHMRADFPAATDCSFCMLQMKRKLTVCI